MTILMFALVLVGLAIMAYLAFVREPELMNKKIQSWCQQNGFEFITLKILSRPEQYRKNYPPQPGKICVTFRRELGADTEEKIVIWEGTWLTGMKLDFPSARPPPSLEKLAKEYDETQFSPEEQVMAEVSRRLDQITSQTGWAEAYDMDASGHVDSEEWDALRRKIEAEVRATMKPSTSPLVVDASPIPVEHAQVDDPADETDGIW